MSKILVIEDEPDQNRLIRLRLEARGYQVISVGKAREGIDLAAREKPALILMDMILPDMHGLDATIKLKKDEATRATPVIGISAVGSPDFIKACLQEGMAAYVRKPYDPRDLFKTIEKLAGPPPARIKQANRCCRRSFSGAAISARTFPASSTRSKANSRRKRPSRGLRQPGRQRGARRRFRISMP